MICLRCAKPIPIERKSRKYCSVYCGIRYLKSEYKKRNKDKVNEYNRRYRKGLVDVNKRKTVGGNKRKFNRIGRTFKMNEETKCYFCESIDGLEWHHISYEIPVVVVRLCGNCHKKIHIILKEYKIK